MVDDAEVVLVTIGTASSTAHEVVDELRAAGKKVGLVKLRFWRPYPTDQMRKIAGKVKAVGVFDRAVSYGVAGPSFIELRNAAYGLNVPIMDFIGGLGGRDVSSVDVRFMYERLLEAAKAGKAKKEITWMGTRGVEQ
jgi:pyruvate/2-oxoacid:ferredoxin oxidoreductase alpha subunit